MAKLNWQRQHIILTGAAGGLGAELAEQLSALGARVLLLGRTETSVQDLAQRLQQPYLTADVTDARGQQQLLDYVELWQHTKTPVTALINNAAVNSAGMLSQQSTNDIAQVIQVNLIAPMQLSALLMPYLEPKAGLDPQCWLSIRQYRLPGPKPLLCRQIWFTRVHSGATARTRYTQHSGDVLRAPRHCNQFK